jgi:hypothetical protein
MDVASSLEDKLSTAVAAIRPAAEWNSEK